jgi:hypothetical protein
MAKIQGMSKTQLEAVSAMKRLYADSEGRDKERFFSSLVYGKDENGGLTVRLYWSYAASFAKEDDTPISSIVNGTPSFISFAFSKLIN